MTKSEKFTTPRVGRRRKAKPLAVSQGDFGGSNGPVYMAGLAEGRCRRQAGRHGGPGRWGERRSCREERSEACWTSSLGGRGRRGRFEAAEIPLSRGRHGRRGSLGGKRASTSAALVLVDGARRSTSAAQKPPCSSVVETGWKAGSSNERGVAREHVGSPVASEPARTRGRPPRLSRGRQDRRGSLGGKRASTSAALVGRSVDGARRSEAGLRACELVETGWKAGSSNERGVAREHVGGPEAAV